MLLYVSFSNNKQKNIESFTEFETLTKSIQINPVKIIIENRNIPHPKYLIGKGKIDEIKKIIDLNSINSIFVNYDLTSKQEKTLETLLQCRIIDRTSLILKIFSKRARTYEGKLQIKLAKLKYFSNRLVHHWSHLERQRGGIGIRGGPGETQLEKDRRLIHNKIQKIRSCLQKVRSRRKQNRNSRKNENIPTISLIGYTNSGKSTLFNKLTNSTVHVANQLFSTLDPTLRSTKIDYIGKIILSDTVGLIRCLPNDLITAFQATLEEIKEADLLLHIVDITNDSISENILAVENILNKIQADKIPIILIMNKIDKLNQISPYIKRNNDNLPICIYLSAKKENGIQLLLQSIIEHFSQKLVSHTLYLSPKLNYLRNRFYKLQAIENETINKKGQTILKIKLPIITWNQLCKKEKNLTKCISH